MTKVSDAELERIVAYEKARAQAKMRKLEARAEAAARERKFVQLETPRGGEERLLLNAQYVANNLQRDSKGGLKLATAIHRHDSIGEEEVVVAPLEVPILCSSKS